MSLGTSWAKFRKDALNTSSTSATGIGNPTTNWVFNSVAVWSNIAVGTDNKLRFIGSDQKIYCIDNSGVVSWSNFPGYPDDYFDSYSNVVLDDANNAYVGAKNGALHKFLADGTWVTPLSYNRLFDEPISNIVFLSNDKLLNINSTATASMPKSISSYDNTNLSLIAGINLVSKGLVGNYFYSQGIPVIHNNYVAFILSSGFNVDDNAAQLVVVQISDPSDVTGLSVVWNETPYRSFAFPAIDSSGYLYAVQSGTILVKKTLSSNTTVFTVAVGQIANMMAPSIDSNNNIIIVNAANKMYSVSSAGVINWQIDISGLTGAAGFPVSIDGDNNIYIAQGSKLLKYNSSGVSQWSFDLAGNAVSSPVVSNDGYIYVPTDHGINSVKQAATVQISGYNLYRSTQPNVAFQKINAALITDSNYSDINLVSGNYYYMVKAVSIMGVESDKTTVIGPLKVNVSSPGKPQNLQSAVVDINNSKGIKLTWDNPLFNQDGSVLKDLAGFDVYRATISQSSIMTSGSDIQMTGSSFDQLSGYTTINKINSSIVPLNTYTDFDVNSGYYYYYSVRAKNFDGNQGPYADEIRGSLSLFKMKLVNGDNVIGFPFDDASLHGTNPNMQVSKLVDAIGIDKVSKIMRWNENAQVYEQYPDFSVLEVSRGYVVILLSDNANVELDINGSDWPVNTSVTLKSKLNLINLPLNDFTDVRALVNALGGSQNVEFVTRYNSNTGSFEQYIPAVDKGDFTILEAGYGYYVFLTSSLTNKVINFAGSSWL